MGCVSLFALFFSLSSEPLETRSRGSTAEDQDVPACTATQPSQPSDAVDVNTAAATGDDDDGDDDATATGALGAPTANAFDATIDIASEAVANPSQGSACVLFLFVDRG